MLLPCEGVELQGVMPTAVITPQDLPYIARVARNNGHNDHGYPLLDDAAIDRTLRLLDGLQGDLTLDDHMRNSRENGREKSARVHVRPAHPGALNLQ